MQVWGTFPIENRTTYLWRVGSLALWLFRDERQWYWASDYAEQPAVDDPVIARQAIPPEGISWQRLITQSLSPEVVVAPLLPDRPVVVVPSEPLSIAAHTEVWLYVSLPLWLQLRGGERLSEKLGEFGVAALSNTWLGDTFSGRMCYTLQARIGYEPSAVTVQLGEALCCLHIANLSEVTAILDKLAIPCDIMALYRCTDPDATADSIPADVLTTSGIELSFGRANELQVRLQPETAAMRAAWARVSDPRVRAQDSVWHKSISLLKKIGEY